jgi:hypothetical protein
MKLKTFYLHESSFNYPNGGFIVCGAVIISAKPDVTIRMDNTCVLPSLTRALVQSINGIDFRVYMTTFLYAKHCANLEGHTFTVESQCPIIGCSQLEQRKGLAGHAVDLVHLCRIGSVLQPGASGFVSHATGIKEFAYGKCDDDN